MIEKLCWPENVHAHFQAHRVILSWPIFVLVNMSRPGGSGLLGTFSLTHSLTDLFLEMLCDCETNIYSIMRKLIHIFLKKLNKRAHRAICVVENNVENIFLAFCFDTASV